MIIEEQVSLFARGLLRSFPTMRRSIFACFVLAVLYSALSTIGYIYAHAHTITGWLDVLSPSWLIFVAFVGQVIVLFIISYVVVYIWKVMAEGKSTACLGGKPSKASMGRFGIYAAAIFAIWLIWIVPHYPGTLRDDTLAQMFQWYQVVDYYTQHPVTDTVIFGVFFSLGDFLGARESGIFIYILVQAALTSLGFAYALDYLRRNGVPVALVWALLLFYAFARVIYQPIDTMSKDALSAIFFVPAVVLMVDVIKSQGTSLSSVKQMAALCALVFCCVVTKRTMLYVFLIAFAVLVVWLLAKRAQWARVAISFLVPALCALLIWNPLVNMAVGATENRTYEMYSIPVQQITRTLISHPEALSEAEYERLGEFLDYEEAVRLYNPWRSDEVNTTEVENPNTMALLEIWVKLGVRHPASYVAAFFDLTGNWYPVLNRITYGHDSHEELESEPRMEAWSNAFFDGDRQAADDFFDSFDLNHPSWAYLLLSIEEWIDGFQSRIPLISSYGFYCFFMPILAIAYCAATRNTRGLLALAVPVALMFSFLVGPIALYWYTIPMVYIFPIILCTPIVLPQPPSSCRRT